MIVHIPKAAVIPELASDYEACAAGVEQQSDRTWLLDDQTPRYAALVVKLKEIRRAEFLVKMTAPPASPPQRRVSSSVEVRAAARLAICQGCPHLAGVGLRKLSVLCPKQRRRCSCPNGEVSLVSGYCPEQPSRW